MKPSASKARVAARVAKHRQRVKDKAEMNRQQQANLDKMDVPERILYDMTVSALLDSAKAQMPAKVAAVIAKAEIKARKEEEQLTTTRTDSDGKIVHEPMRDRYGEKIRQDKAEPPPPPPPPARALTHAERVAPASTAKPMNKWSMAELQAHKQANQRMYAPPADTRGTLAWFIAACNHRNGY